jgi:hypothetical protein
MAPPVENPASALRARDDHLTLPRGHGKVSLCGAVSSGVGRAISGPLTPVTRGLSRSLADSPTRRSGHVTGPVDTDSQADSVSSYQSAYTYGGDGCG